MTAVLIVLGGASLCACVFVVWVAALTIWREHRDWKRYERQQAIWHA